MTVAVKPMQWNKGAQLRAEGKMSGRGRKWPRKYLKKYFNIVLKCVFMMLLLSLYSLHSLSGRRSAVNQRELEGSPDEC